MIKIVENQIDVSALLAEVQHFEAGAFDLFLGTVRNYSNQKTVIRLEYEAHKSMAVSEMKKIASQAKKKWPVKALAIVHRIGVLEIGEIAVAIAVATPHRKEAFEACEFIIDTLKETVPIWKKEFYQDGESWIAAHP